jgi:hypothetical protein
MIKLIITLILTLVASITNAQLRGSGKTITKTYDYQNFDKLNFQDLDGTILVEIGKTWHVEVTIDDNLLPLLTFEEDKNEFLLKIFFKGNQNNKKYIAEIKGAVDFGYPHHFFCEVASKKELDTEWEPSFWLGQNIDLFCYYSFRENKLFMYNGKIFKAAAFDKLEANALFDIPAKTARGFKYDKRSNEAGFLGVISDNTAEDI